MSESGLNIQKCVATADIYELLSLAFDFPNKTLANGLCSGAYANDFLTCLSELGCKKEVGIKVQETSPGELFGDLKREYSRLFLSPGNLTVIYPYESAFLHIARGVTGFPTLFANPIVKDVEKQMSEASALPADYRKEPVDSIHKEFAFMCTLKTLQASALFEDADEQAKVWAKRSIQFRLSHIDIWVPQFLEQTIEYSRLEIYRNLAKAAANALQATAE